MVTCYNCYKPRPWPAQCNEADDDNDNNGDNNDDDNLQLVANL